MWLLLFKDNFLRKIVITSNFSNPYECCLLIVFSLCNFSCLNTNFMSITFHWQKDEMTDSWLKLFWWYFNDISLFFWRYANTTPYFPRKKLYLILKCIGIVRMWTPWKVVVQWEHRKRHKSFKSLKVLLFCITLAAMLLIKRLQHNLFWL